MENLAFPGLLVMLFGNICLSMIPRPNLPWSRKFKMILVALAIVVLGASMIFLSKTSERLLILSGYFGLIESLFILKIKGIIEKQGLFLTAERSEIILATKFELPEELVVLGGHLESWGSERSGRLHLKFPQKNFSPRIIKSDGVVTYFFSPLGEEEVVIKVTPDKISLVNELPDSLREIFLELALEDVILAACSN